MGQRGPLKLPRHLSPVDTGGDTLADQTKPGMPPLPPNFPRDPEMVELWEYMLPLLDDAGLLARTDGLVLELALGHFLSARQASDDLVKDGPVVKDVAHGRHNGGVKKNPADAVFRSQSALFLEYAKQLGMTFSARARTPGRKEDPGEDNPFGATG